MKAYSTVLAMAMLFASGGAGATSGTGNVIARDFIRARAADILGDSQGAAAGYAQALAASPGDEALALRAFRQGLLAGDEAVAAKGARSLEAAGKLPVDGTLLLLGQAIEARDWKQARARTEATAQDRGFGFLAPVLRAWIAFGSHQGDPLEPLSAGLGDRLATPYINEHRVLLLLALDRPGDAVAAYRTLNLGQSVHALRLRTAIAARLASRGRRDEAARILEGEDAALVAARARLAAGRPVGDPIETAGEGVSELLVRLAVDLNGDRPSPVSLSLARLATFVAPSNAEAWLVAGSLLAATDRGAAGVVALDRIGAHDPLASFAASTRLQILVREDDDAAALKAAKSLVEAPGAGADEWARLGNTFNTLGRYGDAADAYARAIAAAERAGRASAERWQLYLLRGSALDQAGDWSAARPMLEKAVKLAPDEPQALNYLGYAQLARRQNVAAATRMVERASQLAPENAAITDSLGWAYYLNGDVPKAIGLLEQAAGGEPGDTEINEHLGDAYWRAGRQFEARYSWRAALVTAEGAEAERLRGKIANGNGQNGNRQGDGLN